MATFLSVLRYVWPIVAGLIIAELWRQNRSLRRQVSGQQRVIRKLSTPSGVIEVNDTLTSEQVEEFKRRWLEAVSQPASAYKIRVLDPCICPHGGERNPRCGAHEQRSGA